MSQRLRPGGVLCPVIALVALGLGCDESSPTSPTSPTRATPVPVVELGAAAVPGASDAIAAANPVATVAADGSTLKVTAPTPVSPTNNQVVGTSLMPMLTATTAAGRFVPGTFEHWFEVWEIAADGTTTLVEAGTATQTADTSAYAVQSALEEGSSYQWRVRAVRDGFVGPWSVWATFRTPILLQSVEISA